MIRTAHSEPERVRWRPDRHDGDGVLVVAGSSGRIDEERAKLFAQHGCLAESIRWFGGPSQHDGPWEIPLETFLERIEDLKRDCDRVFMVGTSFGSEAALLCGALSESVTGVVAFAPSDVVWAGYDAAHRETSHWSKDGVSIPFVPIDWEHYEPETPSRFLPLYLKSRRAYASRLQDASIPVERINRCLLVAGGDDQVWPSMLHAERIRARRKAAGRATTVVTAQGAGHRTILPGEAVVHAGAHPNAVTPEARGGARVRRPEHPRAEMLRCER